MNHPENSSEDSPENTPIDGAELENYPTAMLTPNSSDDNESQDTATTEDSGIKISDTPFFPVSEGKLITLYILSYGLYGVYWFYKNWKLQQPLMEKKIYPVWRAIFSIFFTHALFKRINLQASHLEQKHRFNGNALATFFVITIIASNVLDRLYGSVQTTGDVTSNTIIIISLVLLIVSVIPMVKAQATVNRINDDMLGYLNHKFSLANYVLITLGSISWILILLGLVFESMGLSTTTYP